MNDYKIYSIIGFDKFERVYREVNRICLYKPLSEQEWLNMFRCPLYNPYSVLYVYSDDNLVLVCE